MKDMMSDIDTMRKAILLKTRNPVLRWRITRCHDLTSMRSFYFDIIKQYEYQH